MEKIEKYINELFKGVTETKRTYELKEEIISNSIDKYNDLIKEGKDDKKAYEEVIIGIGDIDELISELTLSSKNDNTVINENRKKSAFVVSICVGLYILSIIPIIIFEELEMPEIYSVVSFLVLSGIATCILIYHFMSTPKYKKVDTSMVEEFKEWKGTKDKRKEIKSAISSIVWTLIVVIYFITSFVFNIWYISWIIFIIGVVIESIINLVMKLKEI